MRGDSTMTVEVYVRVYRGDAGDPHEGFLPVDIYVAPIPDGMPDDQLAAARVVSAGIAARQIAGQVVPGIEHLILHECGRGEKPHAVEATVEVDPQAILRLGDVRN